MKNNMMEKSSQEVSFKRFAPRKVMTMFMVVCMVVCMAVAASADEVTTVTASDWQPVIDAMTAQISVSTIIAVLAVVVAACVGLVFMWWGLRKASGALMSAFRKGKLSV